MSRWLRHHRYALHVAWHRLLQHPFSSCLSIAVIALLLALPVLGAAVLQSSQPLTRQLSVAPELTLFLQEDADAGSQQAVLRRIQQQDKVQIGQVRQQSRTQALAQLRADPAWAQALDALPDNPLPDAIIVGLEGEDLAQQAARLAEEWAQWPEVSHVQLDSEWVQRLETLLTFGRLALFLVAAAVIVVVLATVFNTVRLQALTQREEIAVARLVGATESFVRRPFLYLGALTGLAASVLAIALASIALVPLNRLLNDFAQSYGLQWSIRLPATSDLILWSLLIIALGALAARLSVTRHTTF